MQVHKRLSWLTPVGSSSSLDIDMPSAFSSSPFGDPKQQSKIQVWSLHFPAESQIKGFYASLGSHGCQERMGLPYVNVGDVVRGSCGRIVALPTQVKPLSSELSSEGSGKIKAIFPPGPLKPSGLSKTLQV